MAEESAVALHGKDSETGRGESMGEALENRTDEPDELLDAEDLNVDASGVRVEL